jgi:REP element-mobilizing transposase RayT
MPEIFEPGYFYHVYNRGNNKENIFIEDKNYSFFLKLVSKHLLPISEIYSSGMMKNHFHILLRIKDYEELPHDLIKDNNRIHQLFSNLFNTYTKAINKAYNRTGSLFQEHLNKIRVIDLAFLQHLVAYIHLNPVKHEFTDDFKKYKYSSFQSILSTNSTKLKRNEVIGFFDDIDNFVFWHDLRKIRLDGIIREIEKIDG